MNQQIFQGGLAARQLEEFENEDQEVSEMILCANSILSDFHREAEISSLDTAIFLHQNALHLRAAPHSQRSASLRGLGLAFAARFHRTGQLQDLHEAISLLWPALVLLPTPHADRLALLHDLVAVLLIRCGKMKDTQDLRDARSQYAEAQDLALSGSRSTMRAAQDNHDPGPYVRTTNQHYVYRLKPFSCRNPLRLCGMRLPRLKLEIQSHC
jgi:hypothetical protein